MRAPNRYGGVAPRAVRRLQSVLLHALHVRQQRPRRSVGDEPAAVEQQHAGTRLQDQLQVVRRDHLRAGQAVDEPDELAAAARVKVQRRLVQQQHLRPHRQHAGQGHAPLLAAGQVERRPLFQSRQRHRRQRLRRPAAHLVGRQAEVQRAEGHVVEHRGVEELVVAVLEDDADAGRQPATLGRVARIEAADLKRPRLRRDHAGQAQEQTRFARAIGADQADALAGRDLERNAVQSRRSLRVAVGQFAHLDGGVGGHGYSSCQLQLSAISC